MEFCKCGKIARPRQRTCTRCHRKNTTEQRARSKLIQADLLAFVNRHLLAFDPVTARLFEERISTRFVEVLTGNGVVAYRGVPVGFLPDDKVMVWHDATLHTFDLTQLKNYGP